MSVKPAHSKCQTSFCREGVSYTIVVAVILLTAVLRQVNPMLLFASLLVCPLFIALAMSRKTVRQLSVKRKVPSHVHAGETFVAQIEVTNERPKISSWGVVVEDHLELSESGTGRKQPVYQPAIYFDHVKPGETKRMNYVGRLPERGHYQFQQMLISTRFPCGFFRSHRSIDVGQHDMLVLPKLGKLAAGWITRQHDANETVLRSRYRPSRVTGEFLGVRGWQQGDVKRWVHWRASARHNQLVVRQYEQHQNRDAAILLDLYHPGSVSRSVEANIELAVSFAATLTSEIVRRGGCNLTFATFQEKTELYHGPSTVPLLEQILERLAVVQMTSSDRLPDLFLEILSNTDPSADLILVSHNAVQLTEHERFQKLKNDPKLRTLTQRVRIVSTSDNDFYNIFEMGEKGKS